MSKPHQNSTPPVRLAVVGAGVIGKKHLATIAGQPGARLVAIADPQPGVKDLAAHYGVAAFSDIHHLLEMATPDGVIVCTPTEHHLEPTLAALEGNADVLVEKPLAANLDETCQIIAMAKKTGKQVLVGHHRRHAPVLARAREIITSGEIGALVTVSGQWTVKKDDDYFLPAWRKRRAAGPVLTNLIHEIDTIRHLCGEICSVSAELGFSVRGLEKEDTAALVMRFANGAIGTFIVSDATPSPWTWEQATGENPAFPAARQNTHRFTGTLGGLEFPGLVLWRHAGNHQSWHDPIGANPVASPLGDAFARQCAHFCAIIRGHEAPLVSVQDGAKTLAATLAVFEAAECGCRVELDTNRV
ncbi:MAG: Gfo/Idh/MocA family protein [Alphaproteobacteria bacterium]